MKAAHRDAGQRAHMSRWYADWQSADHARAFDGRHVLTARNLVRNYESFNDVQLIHEYVDASRPTRLVEVGCATGEFYRYLRIRYPRLTYWGVDISEVAIARAKEKYPQARFFVTEPTAQLADALRLVGLSEKAEVVYAKDVVHHQTRPLEFVSQLLDAAPEAVIMRLRTRDVGATVTDPELSCQYHYHGWMPYIVLNLQELIDHIKARAPRSELRVYRHRMVLGGQHNRFLPKDCYLSETGTAETAVGVFSRTTRPGEVRVEDRKDQARTYSMASRVSGRISQMLSDLVAWRSRDGVTRGNPR